MTLPGAFARVSVCVLVCSLIVFAFAASMTAQSGPYERSYRQSKPVVEGALKQLRSSMGGRLPALEGFAVTVDHPLSRYQRGYYQSTVQVSPAPSGGSIVRVSAKVTAWYSDPNSSRSGYQLLTSNGRLETDLLDQLTELLVLTPAGDDLNSKKPAPATTAEKSPEQMISAPMPNVPKAPTTFSSSVHGLSPREMPDPKLAAGKSGEQSSLQAEAATLEEALKNQAHPRNIVAVKKSGTPVVAAPSLTAKALFMASLHDEFEMLDFNRDWVHVRVSGLSRAWIWRDSLEMPDSVPDNPELAAGPAPAADLFQVTREETAPFPGDWEPLRGKTVKIVSVQKTHEAAKEGGPREKLQFAKSVLDKNYFELAQKPRDLAGIVLIFDSADGGMIAATFAALEQWKAGTLSDAALWHKCFFDPPETFVASGSSGGR